MAKVIPQSNISDKEKDRHVAEFVKGLTTEHKMLIVLKTQLYSGSWTPMAEDLKNRLDGKPYIFKLANRINDDVERIEQMRKFEEQFGVSLADYVDSVD